ncbi:MAG: tetratricopeptide repeat protein [Planctomycetes bacterium]|nr:tetratricopeptide repeat protein [Planctomycetota bacterium]
MRVLSELMLGEIEGRSRSKLRSPKGRKEATDKSRSHYCEALKHTIPPLNEWDRAVNRLLLRKFTRYSGSNEALMIYKHQPEERYLVELGQWLRRQGRGYEMLALYEDYLLRDCRVKETRPSPPDFQPRINEQIIDALLLVGQGEILVEQLRHLLEENTQPDVYRDLGYALIQQTRYQEGLVVLGSFLAASDPSLASDYAWVGNLCSTVGLVDKAIEYYELALETKLTDVERHLESMSSSMGAPPNTWKQRYKARMQKTLEGLYQKQGQSVAYESGAADRLSQARAWAYFARVPLKEGVRTKQRAQDASSAQGAIESPSADLDVLRAQAHTLLAGRKDYSGAAALYRQILKKAPTDVKSMVHLAEAHERMNRLDEALALCEKVTFDPETRRWWGSLDMCDYASGNLMRLYGQNKDLRKSIRLVTLTSRGDFKKLKANLKTRDEHNAFHAHLMEQWEQTPDNLKLNFFLIHHFVARRESQKAVETMNRLYARLSTHFGSLINIDHAMQLAQGFECLGQYDQALSLLSLNSAPDDLKDRFAFELLLMRLYAKTNQFERALEICQSQLEQDAKGGRTLGIAECIYDVAQGCETGLDLLIPFVDDLQSRLDEQVYRRFRGAVWANLNASQERTGPAGVAFETYDPVVLIEHGRLVQNPTQCKNASDYLKKLAFEAETLATQSYINGRGTRRLAPRINKEAGTAFEILAEVLNKSNVPFEITERGYWAFYESDDKRRATRYAASGGVLCRLESVNLRQDQSYMDGIGRLLFEPAVKRLVASAQSCVTVLEARDNRGRKLTAPEAEDLIWDSSGQIHVELNKKASSSRTIQTLRVKTEILIGTQWTSLTLKGLDFKQPFLHEENGLTLELVPAQDMSTDAESQYAISILIHNQNVTNPNAQIHLKSEFLLTTSNGTTWSPHISGAYKHMEHSKITLGVDTGVCDLKTTSLTIKLPLAWERIPLEFTFHDVPVVRR